MLVHCHPASSFTGPCSFSKSEIGLYNSPLCSQYLSTLFQENYVLSFSFGETRPASYSVVIIIIDVNLYKELLPPYLLWSLRANPPWLFEKQLILICVQVSSSMTMCMLVCMFPSVCMCVCVYLSVLSIITSRNR